MRCLASWKASERNIVFRLRNNDVVNKPFVFQRESCRTRVLVCVFVGHAANWYRYQTNLFETWCLINKAFHNDGHYPTVLETKELTKDSHYVRLCSGHPATQSIYCHEKRRVVFTDEQSTTTPTHPRRCRSVPAFFLEAAECKKALPKSVIFRHSLTQHCSTEAGFDPRKKTPQRLDSLCSNSSRRSFAFSFVQNTLKCFVHVCTWISEATLSATGTVNIFCCFTRPSTNEGCLNTLIVFWVNFKCQMFEPPFDYSLGLMNDVEVEGDRAR